MDEITCEICFKAYDGIERIPKVLVCGHTFCGVCLGELVKSSATFPCCKESITKNIIDDIPTNFALLSASQECRKYTCTKSHLLCSMDTLKTVLLVKKENLLKYIAARSGFKNQLVSDIARIQSFLDMDKDEIDTKLANKVINEIEGNLDKLDDVLPEVNLKMSVSYSLSEYLSKKQFLYHLSVLLHKGEKIYARKYVEGKLKYGEISLKDELIILHALSLSKVDKKASVILVSDFQKSLDINNLYLFLEVTADGEDTARDFLFLADKSPFLIQFMQLCTGETGPTYKGMKVTGVLSGLSVAGYLLNDKPSKVPIEYNSAIFDGQSIADSGYVREEAFVLTGEANGAFEIKENAQKVAHSNVIGTSNDNFKLCNKITHPAQYSEIKNYGGFSHHNRQRTCIRDEYTETIPLIPSGIVSDCGIAFKL